VNNVTQWIPQQTTLPEVLSKLKNIFEKDPPKQEYYQINLNIIRIEKLLKKSINYLELLLNKTLETSLKLIAFPIEGFIFVKINVKIIALKI